MKSSLEIRLEGEISRNKELIKVYSQLPGGAGAFAQMAIEQDIDQAEHAIQCQDAAGMVKMIRCMEGNE